MISLPRIIALLLFVVVLSNKGKTNAVENVLINKKSFFTVSGSGNSSVTFYIETDEDLEDDEEGDLNHSFERKVYVSLDKVNKSSGFVSSCKKNHLKRYLLLQKIVI